MFWDMLMLTSSGIGSVTVSHVLSMSGTVNAAANYDFAFEPVEGAASITQDKNNPKKQSKLAQRLAEMQKQAEELQRQRMNQQRK